MVGRVFKMEEGEVGMVCLYVKEEEKCEAGGT